MTTLTEKFTAFETQVGVNHAELMAALIDIQASLDLVASNTDIALENGAANTKAILAALGQSAACFPCPSPSVIVPPISTTPTVVDTDHCQRSQWIISTIQSIIAQIDVMQSYNVTATFNVLNDAISEVVSAIAAGDTIPLPTFPEVTQMVGTYFNYVGERIFSGVDASSQFSPLYGDLVAAVNLSSDAGNARSQYDAVIDASSASSAAKQLFKAIGYNALWSYAFDTGSSPDLSAFDGEACGVALADLPACANFGSALVTHGSFDFYELVIPVAYPGHPAFITGDYFGWTFELLSNTAPFGVSIYYLDTGDSFHLAATLAMGSDPYPFVVHTNAIAVQTLDHNPDAHPFVMRICPP